ncbi:MAG: tRNA (adenosine(37)-N6)-threonylcarbamoyltransferase complex ATPase subunit type 1 TsaE [Spirochaetes bacterium]|nr:tRNA (adenosine(37)-N6)-threonylcarbamoyltransferase complex ATPase subunit type 1 TsaE [Spirochaetota bacterium]
MLVIKVTYFAHDLAGFIEIAETIASLLAAPVAVLISGELGAGKTTMVSAMLRTWGVESAGSPTFNLRNDYRVAERQIIHIDCYRLKAGEGVFDILPPDGDYSSVIAFIEWPERAGAAFSEMFVQIKHIRITVGANGARTIETDVL